MKKISLLTFLLCLAWISYAFAVEPVLLADNVSVKTRRLKYKAPKGDRFYANWNTVYKDSQGEPVSIKISTAASKTKAATYSYIWRGVYEKLGHADLAVELYINSKKVMFIETPGITSLGFDHELPNGEVLEVFIDGSTFISNMVIDARVVGKMPALDTPEN